MEDNEIIKLFFSRSEKALTAASKKYGAYCRTVAVNILDNDQDAEECVNDTLMRAWNSIPPNNPNALGAYLAKITKNLALDKVQFLSREKRSGVEAVLSFDELEDFLSDENALESEIERHEIIEAVNDFLKRLPEKKRLIFIGRYWGCCKLSELGNRFGMSESSVSVYLGRIQKKLKEYLKKRGFDI
ncbi:MAG: sigma-70 family RNA polymerase sigma factor [Firmicutes bacterium]|nr:sigma-70 family RNA polymerase sigma factor [Bacillota bacterium]